jgi:hypothetical protein
MKRVLRKLIVLYPKAWRERYGEEFAAMVDQMERPGWGDACNVAFSAARERMRRAGPVWAMGLAGALAGGLIPQLLTPDYVASTTVRPAASRDWTGDSNRALKRVTSRHRLKNLVEFLDLYPADRERQPMEDLVEKARQAILATPEPGGRLRLHFRYSDAAIAGRALNHLAAGLERDLNLNTRDALWIREVRPNPAPFALAGFAAGALAARLRRKRAQPA